MGYEKWKARLAGEKVQTFVQPDEADCGYYRKPITEKELGANGKTNGRSRIVGWLPVAYFTVGDRLACLLDNREVEARDESLWSWVVAHPISYETYRLVADDGQPWPDAPQPARLSENAGAVPQETPKPPETAEDFKARIETLIAATAEAKVETDAEANAVNGSVNRLAEVRLQATHAGEAIYKPHYARYKAAYDLWTPIVKEAETEERRLTRLLLVYREGLRKKEAAETAILVAAAREAEEASRRAADRAIANGGESAPSQGLVEWAEAQEETAPPASPPTPPSTVTPTHGKRKVREQMRTFVEITDIDKVFACFKEAPEVRGVLHALALHAVKAGRDVPGITKREGLV